jgi:methionyl-tRNA synthetase
MSEFWKTATQNPKTTISGILSFVAITSATLAPFIPQTASRICIGLAISGALSRAYLGAISKDAGTEQAIVPGSADPQTVPSHEVPDNPKAQVTKN